MPKSTVPSGPPSTVGSFLRQKRIAQGLSQAEVANQFGVTRPVITNIESDKRSLKSGDVVRLSRILSFTLKDFYKIAAQAQPQSS